MNRVMVLLGLAVFLQASGSVLAQAQRQVAPTLQVIEACRAVLTGAGRNASFQETAVYEALSMA